MKRKIGLIALVLLFLTVSLFAETSGETTATLKTVINLSDVAEKRISIGPRTIFSDEITIGNTIPVNKVIESPDNEMPITAVDGASDFTADFVVWFQILSNSDVKSISLTSTLADGQIRTSVAQTKIDNFVVDNVMSGVTATVSDSGATIGTFSNLVATGYIPYTITVARDDVNAFTTTEDTITGSITVTITGDEVSTS